MNFLQYLAMISVLGGSFYVGFIERKKWLGWLLFAFGSALWALIGYLNNMHPLMIQGLVFIAIEGTVAIRLYLKEREVTNEKISKIRG